MRDEGADCSVLLLCLSLQATRSLTGRPWRAEVLNEHLNLSLEDGEEDRWGAGTDTEQKVKVVGFHPLSRYLLDIY